MLAAVSADGYLSFWHAPSGKCIFWTRDPKDADLFCLDYNPDGSMLAVGNKNAQIHVFDEATKSIVATLEAHSSISPGHSNRVFSVRFANDPNLLVSGGWDSTLFFWDLREKKSVGWVYGPHLSSDSLDIQGDTLLSGSYNDKDVLQLWSLSQRKLIETIPWKQDVIPGENELGFLYTATFGHGTSYIGAGGAGINEYKIFSQGAKHELLARVTLPKSVTSSDFSHKKNTLVLSSGDGSIRLFALEHKAATEATQ